MFQHGGKVSEGHHGGQRVMAPDTPPQLVFFPSFFPSRFHSSTEFTSRMKRTRRLQTGAEERKRPPLYLRGMKAAAPRQQLQVGLISES